MFGIPPIELIMIAVMLIFWLALAVAFLVAIYYVVRLAIRHSKIEN